MNAIPVKYVGLRAKKSGEHIVKTGLTWTPGQVHFVPADAAVKLVQYEDQWRVATEADLADPSCIGFVIDGENATVETPEERAAREEQEEAILQSLPNLEPLPKDSIAAFARREFGVELDPSSMKKAAMLSTIRGLASSRGAAAKLDSPGVVNVVAEVSAPEPVVLVAKGEVEMGTRVEGHIDPDSLPVTPTPNAPAVPVQVAEDGSVVVPSFTGETQ